MLTQRQQSSRRQTDGAHGGESFRVACPHSAAVTSPPPQAPRKAASIGNWPVVHRIVWEHVRIGGERRGTSFVRQTDASEQAVCIDNLPGVIVGNVRRVGSRNGGGGRDAEGHGPADVSRRAIDLGEVVAAVGRDGDDSIMIQSAVAVVLALLAGSSTTYDVRRADEKNKDLSPGLGTIRNGRHVRGRNGRAIAGQVRFSPCR